MSALVSVVVPCRNERPYIGSCLDSLMGNDYNSLEIIVVDGLSDDGTREVLSGYEQNHANIRVFDNPAFITPTGLNKGIARARGSYIMVAGAHTTFPENYISTLVQHLEHLDAAGVGGSMITRSDDSVIGQSIAKTLSNRMGVGNSLFRLNMKHPVSVDTVPFGLYKRHVFDRVGYYDERLVRNQDIEFSKRIIRRVGKLYLIPTIRCHYYFKGGYDLLARSNFRNGLWNILAVYFTGNVFSISLRHVVPLLFMIFIFAGIVLGLMGHTFMYGLILAVLLVYMGMLLITAFRINDRSTSVGAIMWSFIVLHFSYGFGSLAGLVNLPVLAAKGIWRRLAGAV